MRSLVLSSRALAVPTTSDEPAVFEQYVEHLLGWRRILDDSLAPLLLSERAVDALSASRLYPFGPCLKDLLLRWSIDYISLNDLLRIINDLLQRHNTLEDHVGIADTLCSDLVLQPNIIDASWDSHLAQELHHVFALLAAAEAGPIYVPDSVIVSVPGHNESMVTVSAMMELVQANLGQADATGHIQCPVRKSAKIRLAHDTNTTFAHLDEVALWCAAPSVREAESVVRMLVSRFQAATSTGPSASARPFVLRQELLDSSARFGFRNDPPKVRRLLATLVDVILARDEGHGHALRTGQSGANPPIKRNKDFAWRHDVDYEFHLHFWKTAGGTLEFAVLVPHNDFNIPW